MPCGGGSQELPPPQFFFEPQMRNLRQSITRDPLWLIGTLWPLVLLAPLVPGLPTQTVKGLPWRQEVVLALLLSVTLVLLARRAHRSGVWLSNLLHTEVRTLLP